MRKFKVLSFVAASTAAATVAILAAKAARAEPRDPLRSVQAVDLHRYLGTWYEIARYPNRFERKCDADITATYSQRDDGKIQVVNSCRKADGSFTTSKGSAKVVDKKTNAKLKVTFFWPFSGDYWVVGLDSDYRFAVVGEPSRKYVWILSRTPDMPPLLYDEAIRIVREAGYDVSRLIKTRHTGKATPVAS